MALVNGGTDQTPTALQATQASLANDTLNVAEVYLDSVYVAQAAVTEAGLVTQPEVAATMVGGTALQQESSSLSNSSLNVAEVYEGSVYVQQAAVTPVSSGALLLLPQLPSAPTFTSLDPLTGVVTGGYGFTIIGTNFVTGATVTFGANPATGLSVGAALITGTVPAGTEGGVTVTITNPDTQFVTTSFTYTAVVIPPVPTLDFEPDLGGLRTRFASSLTVSIPFADLTAASGAESNVLVKGFGGVFRLTINGTTYEIPVSIRRKIRAKNGGRVFWQAEGDSGVFRYFRNAPPVFIEEETLL